jgi:hypothetical protein
VLQTKTYLKALFGVLFFLFSIAGIYTIYFGKHYPLALTSRISFDAKLKFIRENIDIEKVDTVILGSSIGLNNVNGVVLEESSSRCNGVLNMSVYEATALQVEQLFEFTEAFPNLERVIYSAQYSDFPHARKYEFEFDVAFLKTYIRKEENFFQRLGVYFHACKDLWFCWNRQKEWAPKHLDNTKFSYLGFDATGSVPLHIVDESRKKSGRWSASHPNIQNPESFQAVYRMKKRARQRGIRFYVVQQHYRIPLVQAKQDVANAIERFGIENKKVLGSDGGIGGFLSLPKVLDLDDSYHADRSHLNDKGSVIATRKIAKFIDKTETDSHE